MKTFLLTLLALASPVLLYVSNYYPELTLVCIVLNLFFFCDMVYKYFLDHRIIWGITIAASSALIYTNVSGASSGYTLGSYLIAIIALIAVFFAGIIYIDRIHSNFCLLTFLLAFPLTFFLLLVPSLLWIRLKIYSYFHPSPFHTLANGGDEFVGFKKMHLTKREKEAERIAINDLNCLLATNEYLNSPEGAATRKSLIDKRTEYMDFVIKRHLAEVKNKQ